MSSLPTKRPFPGPSSDDFSSEASSSNVSSPSKLPCLSTKDYECRVCSLKFTASTNRRRHEKAKHNFDPVNKLELCCSQCNESFHSRKHVMTHISEAHSDVQLQYATIILKSEEEFQQWKIKFEKETDSFHKVAHTYETKEYRKVQYDCHRSGTFKSTGTGVRHSKVSGSNKSGYFCPASIEKKTYFRDGHTEISYTQCHLGHTCEAGRLPLSVAEKNELAGMLNAGVPIPAVLDKVSETASPTKRLAVTTAQDLRNISSAYGLKNSQIRNPNDALSVDSWVTEVQAGDHNPILVYKLPGEVHEDYPTLLADDFILGFMNEPQEEIFKLYGHDVVSIDSTHGTNKYDIQLTSILVKDDNWEGFPVAFLWSNRQTEEVFYYFFAAIRKVVGSLSVHAFMTDDYPAYFNAWTRAFDNPKFRVLCDWHVKKNLRKHLSCGSTRITDISKREEVQAELEAMVNEVDKTTFQALMAVNIQKWLDDERTSAFADYFIRFYANRQQQWAACYKIDSHINTNMTVERWHKDLKYNSDLKGKCGGRLDLAIHSLLKSLRVKFINRLVSIQRGKLTKKMVSIRKSHDKAKKSFSTLQIFESDTSNSAWLVSSFTAVGEFYTVKKILSEGHKCNLICISCESCLHEYKCNCPDAAIRYNMCKHIHAVCMFARPTVDSQESSTDSNDGLEICPQGNNVEKNIISKELRKGQNHSNLLDLARVAYHGFEIDDDSSEEQLTLILETMTTLRTKYEALRVKKKQLPPITSTASTSRNISPQRNFSVKKKKNLTKIIPKPNSLSKIIIAKTSISAPSDQDLDHHNQAK